MAEAILEVRDLVKHYPLTQGILFKKQIGAVKAVDGVSFDLRGGRDARHRGRVRLRQVDGRQDAGQPGAADGRADQVQGRGHHHDVRARP